MKVYDKVGGDRMKQVQLTICSIEVQRFTCLYALEDGFQIGTIFQELNKPFTGDCHYEW